MPYKPTADDDIPSGTCECGCGHTTKIVTHTIRKRRHYAGYPMPYCHGHGHRTHGPEHHLFTGLHHSDGYVFEYAPEHPAAYKSGQRRGCVAQHRLVWERVNGRLLEATEVVHHINGVRDDNRPENLVALTNSGHCHLHAADHLAGHSDESRQRISDAMARVWAERSAESRQKISDAMKHSWATRKH